MDQGVFELGARRNVSLHEANEIIRIILHFTKQMSVDVDRIINRLEAMDPDNVEKARVLEEEVETIIESWNQKVRKLGAQPKGLWMADVDAGDGFYCWKYPEQEIQYWHDYKSGFPGRVPIKDRIKSQASSMHIVVEPNLN